MQEPARRSFPAPIFQEQGRLLQNPRLRHFLQQRASGPGNAIVLGKNSGNQGGDGGAPGGGVAILGRFRRYLHRHGVQGSVGEVRGAQRRRSRMAQSDLRETELGRGERRRISDKKLPVVYGSFGCVGPNGPEKPGLQKLGENSEIDVQGQNV